MFPLKYISLWHLKFAPVPVPAKYAIRPSNAVCRPLLALDLFLKCSHLIVDEATLRNITAFAYTL
jgi:hypothetical protein